MSRASSSTASNDDTLELEAAGYVQAMPRRFSLWSLGALSFTLTCTWLGTGSSIGISLTEASSAGTLWSLPIAGVMTTIVSLGMAELASAYPVAGAQYYWSFMVARDDYKPFASYLNGWMSVIGWWLASSSVSNFVSSMILDIVGAWHPDWDQKRWHQYLIYVALIWIATAANIFTAQWIPLFNKMIFILSVLTLSATTITLFVVTKEHASAEFIFTDTTNRTGWSTDGFAFMLTVGNAVYAFLGSDCGAHLCEEIPNPAKNVPKVMIYPLLMGLLTAFPFAASLMYAISDLPAVLNTTTGLPLFEIYYQGTRSRPAASVLMSLFAFCFFANLVANGKLISLDKTCADLVATTSSRTLWAVSRDGALPYSQFWGRVHSRFQVPVNALLLSAVFITLYGLIFLGSSTAFSAMVSAAIIFLQTSCVIPQAVLLYRGRDRVLPLRYFSLGKYGAAINGISVAWVVFLDILYCFPTTMPVTPENMSYVSVVFTGLVAFVIALWFTTKKGSFTGPQINLDLLNARRMAAVQTLEGTSSTAEYHTLRSSEIVKED
ncbi:amino acid transporter [Fusarium agapanthi]|uniref:Amino acid transporter n=1 Tax=Fusarium agapanthi TaxID=1803897 RepID=A0A9P5EHN8_9HYPO|nr:amino acid transporter [Fusarium agapanthi]